MPLYHGFYINLDRSVERRVRFEADLARLSLAERYSRFAAVDGRSVPKGPATISPGQLGCFHSHVAVLGEAQSRGIAAHVLEDDALLCEHTEPVVSDAIRARLFDHFDILFTDALLDCDLALLKGMKAAYENTAEAGSRPMRISDFQILDLSRRNFTCLTSYVVGARSIDRILSLYRQEIAAGPRVPVDIFIRDAVHAGKLKAGCIFPFVTSLSIGNISDSTIEERGDKPVNPAVIVMAALRYSFFLGRDLGFAKREMDAATKERRSPNDPHHELIVQALEYVMSRDFEGF